MKKMNDHEAMCLEPETFDVACGTCKKVFICDKSSLAWLEKENFPPAEGTLMFHRYECPPTIVLADGCRTATREEYERVKASGKQVITRPWHWS